MISLEDIEAAKQRIAIIFAQQCRDGPQSEDLRPGYCACGQFLESQSHQRGLHGTAAAIRVLATLDTPDHDLLTRGLVRYAMARLGLEEGNFADTDVSDADNVIKLSETLYALSFVSQRICETEAYVRKIADRLQGSLLQGNGWPYLIGAADCTPSLLPTSHAVRALRAHGFAVDGPVRYLLRQLASSASLQTDKSVQVAAVFVLTYLASPTSSLDRNQQMSAFRRLWDQLSPLLDQDLEANLEYSMDGSHFYVRVPWQLHLIATAAALRPVRCFSSVAAQRRIDAVVSAVLSPRGFAYPHSGDRLSARTNAILFDTLSLVQDRLGRRHPVGTTFYVADHMRAAFDSPPARFLIPLGIMVLIGRSIWEWVHLPTRSFSELAPDFLTTFLLSLLLTRRQRH